MADSDELAGEGGAVDGPPTRNVFSGSAGVVVQGGSFGGDVHIHVPGVRPQSLAPQQLPAPPRPFVNQDGPLSMLNAIAAECLDRSVGLVLVNGLPGSGRKGLARHWAWATRPRFPGGQILIDFAAFSDRRGHAALGDAATACLHALGVADPYVPPTLPERLSLLRTHTSEKPVLMVLENVTAPELARHFLPGAEGSVVLVIGGDRTGDLHVEGAKLVEPERLREADAMQLFADICGEQRVEADIDAARKIVSLCDGFPLAIRIAAARAAMSKRMSLARLAEELTDEGRRLEGLTISETQSVSMAFNVSYRALSPDLAQFYRRLGVSPLRDFTGEQAAVAGGVTTSAADRWLDALDVANLLEVDPTGRCRFPDLVRLHAAERATEEDARGACDEVVRRVVEWLLSRALLADRAVMESDRRSFARRAARTLWEGVANPFTGENAKQAALTWLERERVNLITAVRAAAEHGLADRVWQMAETLTALYFNRRYFADWIESSRLGVEAAKNCDRPDVQARLLINVSRAHTDRGELTLAEAKLDEAMTLAESHGRAWLEASVWEFRGRYLDHIGELDSAIGAFRRSLELNLTADEPRGAALAKLFMGGSLRKAGCVEEALSTVRQAREEFLRLGDTRMAERALLAVGEASAAIGQVSGDAAGDAEAVEALTGAAKALSARRAYHYEAQALEALVPILVRNGEHADAQACLSRVVEIHTESRSPRTPELKAWLASLSG